jgi:hypothetical protein
MLVVILASDRGRNILLPACYVYSAIDDNNVELVMILKNLNLVKRVPVDQDAVGVVPRGDLAELFGSHEQLGNAKGCSNDGFMGSKAEQILEVGKIAGVCAVRSPCEAIIAVEEVSVIL